jgi:hypothetical protein
LVAGVTASTAHASLISVNRSAQGWFAQTGAHFVSNSGTFTGEDTTNLFGTAPLATYRFNSFFVFSLPTISGTTTAAAINLYASDLFNNNASYQFTIFDVGTAASAVSAAHSSGDAAGQAIFADLQSGTAYASFTVPRSYLQQQFHAVLSPATLADITAHSGGLFAVGISFTGSYQTPNGPEGVNFGAATDPQAQLVIGTDGTDISGALQNPVPLPTATAMGLAGLSALAVRRSRRSQQG